MEDLAAYRPAHIVKLNNTQNSKLHKKSQAFVQISAYKEKNKKSRERRLQAESYENRSPPQTTPSKSSQRRSSHSHVLPYTLLSPGGQQVHLPHSHLPAKHTGKTHPLGDSWNQEDFSGKQASHQTQPSWVSIQSVSANNAANTFSYIPKVKLKVKH